MPSFGRLFDFHDAIYHVQYCNVDNGQGNIIFTATGRKNMHFSTNKSYRKF